MSTAMTLAVGLLGWFIARRVGLMSPSMLGSMILVAATNVAFGYATMPVEVKVVAQGIAGAFIAMSITRADLRNIRKLAGPYLLLIGLFTANTLVMGMVIHHLCGIDLVTALFSCVAGGVTDTTLISSDYGADMGTVALMQTSRLVMVLLFFPFWIQRMCRNQPDSPEERPEGDGLEADFSRAPQLLARFVGDKRLKTAFTIVLALVCAWIGKLSGIPSASMVLPMAAVATFNLTLRACSMPRPVKDTARLLAGCLVGSDVTAATFSSLQTTLVPVLLLFASYWVINLVYGKLCVALRLMDLKSALFVSAPGGATDMALIAADLGADLTKIAVIQVMRAVYAVAIMPPAISLFVGLLT